MRLTPILAMLLLTGGAIAAQPDPGMAPPLDQAQDQPPPASPQNAPPGGSGQRQRMTFTQRFDLANVTHDGRLTRAQATGHMGMIARNFDVIDADHKGYVTVQDIQAWHRSTHQARAAQTPPPSPQ